MNKRQMRRSRVLAKLRAGQVAYSFKLNFADPRVAELAAQAGFDCLWTCLEHTPNDYSSLQSQILAAKCYDVDTLCRVPRGSYSDYIRPLEMDAAGIMVPHVMCLQDAREVVRMTRFHPVGRRPVDGGNADGAYCGVPCEDYVEQANRERFVIFQIEDPEPLTELEEIAALPGYDMLFFGPGDFSHALGVAGQMEHPEVVKACERVAAVARQHGKFAGTVATTKNRQSLLDMGYQFLNCSSDVGGLRLYCAEIARACGIVAPNEPVTIY